LGGNPTFQSLLRQVRETTLGAFAHQDLPFAKLVDALRLQRSMDHAPLAQVLFVLQNAPVASVELADLTVQPVDFDNHTARFELVLFMTETDQGLVGLWNYNSDLFEATTIERMTRQFTTLLKGIVEQPDIRLNQISLLSESEKRQQAMQHKERKQSKMKSFADIKPKTVSLVQDQLVKTGYLQPGATMPLVVEPNSGDVDLIEWARNNRDYIEKELLKHGALLFRGFGLTSADQFEQFAQAITPQLFGEYGDLPREGVGGNVYTSTPYPPDKMILYHNESSHVKQWPMKQWFFCVQPSQEGGETPIVDCRKIYQELDPEIRERFAQKGLRYMRNYTDGLDVSWERFFQTSDRAAVEEYCRQAGIDFEWKADNNLRTSEHRLAVAKHPKTGEMVFFNQIQVHHVGYLDQEVQDSLYALYSEENLPRNVYYGDGTPIEQAVIDEILALYNRLSVSFPWQAGDIIMLDNMLVAHARNPYVGPRKIVVAMGEMIGEADL
ncbi:MAG TPA: TauD/TfdA family dioxygenase, partial [Herpetosiphonaceae bacterium]